MTSFKRWNNIVGWAVFAIAALVYLMTMEPVSSLWDCSEFIATSYKLEVGHPPGAPLFMMLARLATLFAAGNPDFVGMAVNGMNSIASAFCILFLFWTITHLARRLVTRDGSQLTRANVWAILGAGIVGALAYTFTDTFWFSAIEGEVYALSSMFTALVVWLMLKWEEEADQPLISIAASTVPSSYILPGIMTGFSDIRPECRFSVLDGDSSFALERLQNGEAVFAFVGTSSRKTIFSYHTVCRDRMVLITPNNKEFAEKKEMGVLGKELLEWPMIMRESGSGTRRETDNYLKSIGMSSADLNVAGYMNNIEGIKSMVAAGKGTTILSERAAADAIRDGRVLCFDLEEDGPYRDIYIAYLKNRSFTQTEQAFLNYVRNRSGEKPKQNKNNKKPLKEE